MEQGMLIAAAMTNHA